MSHDDVAAILRGAKTGEFDSAQTCLAWSPDGAFLLTGGENGVIHALDGKSGHCRFEFEMDLRRSPIVSLAWSAAPEPNGFSATTTRDLLVFGRKYGGSGPFALEKDHVMDGAAVHAAPDSSRSPGQQYLVLHEGRLKGYCRQASPPGAYAIDALAERRPISDLAWSPDGKRLALVSRGGVWATDVPESVYEMHDVHKMTTLLGERLRYVTGGETPVLAESDADPLVAWIDGGRSLAIVDRAGPALVRHDFGWHVQPYHGTVVTRRDLMTAPRALAGDPVHDRLAIVHAGKLSIVERSKDDLRPPHAESRQFALAKPDGAIAAAFSPDGLRLAVTCAVLGEHEAPDADAPHRVTILTLGPAARATRPEDVHDEPDPRYAEGAAPAE